MTRLAVLALVPLLAVAALTLLGASRPAPAPLSAQAARVDPRVLADTAGGRTGHFLVVLSEQAEAARAAARAPGREARGRAVVDALRKAAGATQPAVRARLDALGARYRAYWIVNVIAVEGDRAVVDAMAARIDVLGIEPDRAFRVPIEGPATTAPSAPSGIEWNVTWINAPAVWALGYTGQGRTYANADTGVQWDHPALKPQYRGWSGSTADHNYNWWDAIHADISGDGTNPCGFSSSIPCDDDGHGTHTMGTGVGDDGGTNQVGVAPDARWMACRNMDDGYGRPSTYIECMQFFLAPTDLNGNNADPDKRPDAVGNSYTCPPSELCSAHSLQTAMENLRAAGVFMSVSAGNAGPQCSTVSDPPALEDSAITVGATGFQTDTIAGLSSRGPVTVDGSNRRKPDLVAPGVMVRSSRPTNTYAYLTGTSMASPHVAGAVALLWSAVPALRRDVDLTESVLAQTAQALTTTQGCGSDTSTQVPNNVYGYGRIDVLAAYNYAATLATPTPTATPTATATPTVTPTPEPDDDGDGVGNSQDNCPLDFNPGQENADSQIGNGTGIAGHDATVPNGDPLDTEGDACETDGDADNDGIPDSLDPDTGGDITYDDNGDGTMLNATDDGPSWDADGNAVRDGVEGTCTSSTGDADGDGLRDRWEECKWGTDATLQDSDGDTIKDCREAADVNGDALVDFVGDAVYYAKAALLPAAAFGKDGDFDLNGDGLIDFVGDVVQEAKFALIPGLCQ